VPAEDEVDETGIGLDQGREVGGRETLRTGRGGQGEEEGHFLSEGVVGSERRERLRRPLTETRREGEREGRRDGWKQCY